VPSFAFATRIELICPCADAATYLATNRVIAALQRQRKLQPWGGFTCAAQARPIFTGQFWNTDKQPPDWEEDHNVLIVVDAAGESPTDVVAYFTAMRDKINRIYEKLGRSQKAIWLTAHPIYILRD
jgi:hypothetical protein